MPKYTEKWDASNSSTIDCVYYDTQTKNLFVTFLSGNHAGYTGVPRTVFDLLALTDSAGKYYNRFIRGQYPGVEVKDEFEQRPHGLFVVPNDPSLKTGASQPMDEKPVSLTRRTEKQAYTVRGYVLVEDTFEADSMEEAMDEFRNTYDEAVVKEVVVSFE